MLDLEKIRIFFNLFFLLEKKNNMKSLILSIFVVIRCQLNNLRLF